MFTVLFLLFSNTGNEHFIGKNVTKSHWSSWP